MVGSIGRIQLNNLSCYRTVNTPQPRVIHSTFCEVTTFKFFTFSIFPYVAYPATQMTLFCSKDLVLIQSFFDGSNDVSLQEAELGI